MNCRGMTLLEVMVALMLLAIAGLAMIQTSSGQLRNLNHLEQKQLAYWVADNQLMRIYLQGGWPEENWQQGSTDLADERWYWRWRGISTSDPQLRGIEIEVRLQPKNAHVLAHLHSWRSKSP